MRYMILALIVVFSAFGFGTPAHAAARGTVRVIVSQPNPSEVYGWELATAWSVTGTSPATPKTVTIECVGVASAVVRSVSGVVTVLSVSDGSWVNFTRGDHNKGGITLYMPPFTGTSDCTVTLTVDGQPLASLVETINS